MLLFITIWLLIWAYDTLKSIDIIPIDVYILASLVWFSVGGIIAILIHFIIKFW